MITHIYIFGVGAAGSNVLLNLAAAHPNLSFTVVDNDLVEARNYAAQTQPYTKADVGRPKVQAIQRILAQQGRKIEMRNQRMTSVADIKFLITQPSSVIVDAFDNAVSRNLFLDLGPNVIHVGFSAQLTGEAVWNESYQPMTTSKSDAKIDVCQMRLARPFIMALTAYASMAISDFITMGVRRSFYLDRERIRWY